jgi:hypothetical protein
MERMLALENEWMRFKIWTQHDKERIPISSDAPTMGLSKEEYIMTK